MINSENESGEIKEGKVILVQECGSVSIKQVSGVESYTSGIRIVLLNFVSLIA